MTIGFKTVPQANRVPLFFFELDASRANVATDLGRTLIIGQLTAGGDAVANTPIQSLGVGDAKSRFGVGSMLALMVEWYRKRDIAGDVWCLPVADAAGTAATGTIAVAATTAVAGTLYLYIAGQRVTVPVTAAQAAAAIATAIGAAVNAATDLPVTATVSTTTVTLTAKNKGTLGNDIDIRANYRGLPGGEATPGGVTLTITAMASGATDPTLTTALANLSEAPFDFIVCPYNDATSLDAIKSVLSDTAGRWSFASGLFGHVFTALRGTVSARTTLGLARNNQHETIFGLYDTPTPGFLMAANAAAACAVSLRADPALPLQTVQTDILAPPVASRDVYSQRNTLLYDGVSTFTVGPDGTVAVEGAITTYQTNGFGQADSSYLYVETMFTLMAVIRALRSLVTSKYARVKLADNATRVPPGSNVVTPNAIRADMVALARSMEGGLIENVDAFAAGLIVERDPGNRNRINVLFDPDLINGLRMFAALIQFQQ